MSSFIVLVTFKINSDACMIRTISSLCSLATSILLLVSKFARALTITHTSLEVPLPWQGCYLTAWSSMMMVCISVARRRMRV